LDEVDLDMHLGDQQKLLQQAQTMADEFSMRLDKTEGSLAVLKHTLNQALQHLYQGRTLYR